MRRMIIIGLLFFVLVGCYNRANFTPVAHENFTYTKLASWNDIQIFTDTPSKPFIEIGFIQGEFDSGAVTPSRNIEMLRRKAYEIGADAIIKLNCNPGSGWGPGYCQGTAVKFK